eukprot:209985-Prymnesium_polylepis.2
MDHSATSTDPPRPQGSLASVTAHPHIVGKGTDLHLARVNAVRARRAFIFRVVNAVHAWRSSSRCSVPDSLSFSEPAARARTAFWNRPSQSHADAQKHGPRCDCLRLRSA